MQWDDSEHGGFTTGTPWIAVNPNTAAINTTAAVADPHSVLSHYRRLIALRHEEPTVAHGDFTMLASHDPQVYAFTRRLDDVVLLVLGNFSGSTVTPELPDTQWWAQAEVVLGNYPADDGARNRFTLRPWECLVLRRRGVTTGG